MYKITILKNADWFAPGTVMFDHGYGRHDPVEICLVFFLIEGNGRKILVDTGMDGIDRTYTEKDKLQFDHLGSSKDTRELLAEAGVTCEEIDTVLLTHLHFDHYWNVEQFPNARFIVHRKEWFHVMDPSNLPINPIEGFPRAPLAYLAGEAFDRLTLTGDDYQAAPGISMHWVGGHSPGGMAVKVETHDGPYIIVGDAFYLYEHIEKNIPIGYCTDYREVLQGYEWLRNQNVPLLPAHDYHIFERYPSRTIGSLKEDAT
jgi:glyoxylase-like metal-dependent hydrolase (beta-lactamase superfamily II)